MVSGLKAFHTVGSMAALLAVAGLAACMGETPPPTGGQGGSPAVGTGGRGGSGGALAGGSGGGGPSAGAGGSSRQGGSGGGSSQGGGAGSAQGGSGGSAPVEAGMPPGPDASGGDAVPYSPIAGFGTCVVCHGPEGQGVPMMGPEIQHPVVDFSTWVVRNGRTHPGYLLPMLKYPPETLSDAQLQGIFTFLAARPKPTTGEGLYKDYCANCHGADAKGGVTMRPIDTEPVNVFLTDTRAGHHPGEFSNRREYMPKWTPAELSDAELRLIFTYVDGL
jgi:mono/diheme cytochrome c family protein